MTYIKNGNQSTKEVETVENQKGKTTKISFTPQQVEDITNRATELNKFISGFAPFQCTQVHYFQTKSELTAFSETLQGTKYRTAFDCDCDYNNRRRGILVIDKNNHVTHELIRCKCCAKKIEVSEETERRVE